MRNDTTDLIDYSSTSSVIKRRLSTILFLLQRSWGGWLAFGAFIITFNLNLPTFAGLFIIIAAVMAMNGLAQTDSILARRTPTWWGNHPTLRALHHINSEGEMAGIFIGVLTLLVLAFNGMNINEIHWPIGEAFILYGIMSFANWTVTHMVTVMSFVERFTGRLGVVFLGSLLSAITGEPAAAVFLSEYLQDRVTHEDRPKIATALAGSIGSGGGWLPFAAPPILIIWGILSSRFGWSIVDLMLFIGVGCITHSFIVSIIALKYIQKPKEDVKPSNVSMALIIFLMLTLLVGVHIFFHSPVIWLIDAIIGINVSFTISALYKDKIKKVIKIKKLKTEEAILADEEVEHLSEKAFSSTWQPLLLAFLLLSLEVIGHAAEPFIEIIAHAIPASLPLIVTALSLFYVTALVSHFADNALASRVFIVVALSFAAELGVAAGNLLAIAVVYGALYGGFLMIPANLPNFAISRSFHINSAKWFQSAIGLYWTGIVYAAALLLWNFILIK